MKQIISTFALCLVTSSAVPATSQCNVHVAAPVIDRSVVSANAIRAQVQPASRPVVCPSAEFERTALPLANKELQRMMFVPQAAEQVEIELCGERALATIRREKLSESYQGRGTWRLESEALANNWTTTTRMADDTVFFTQLVPFAEGQEVVVYGLVDSEGKVVVPRQRVIETDECDYYFGAYSSSGVALEQFKLTPSNGNLSASANYMGYEAVVRETGESLGKKSFYFACTWTDPNYVPYVDADFTYSVTTLAPSNFAPDAPTTWTSYLYYGDSGQFADGDTVTVVNPLLVANGRNYECYGVYRDGYIYIPPQYIGNFSASGTNYGLWLGASDGPEYYSYVDYLRLKVSQDGHLLTLDNKYAMILMRKDATLTTPIELERADYFLSLYEKVNMADALATIYENPLEATYYGYGVSEYSGAMQWTMGVECDAATGVLTLEDLFAITGWEGWRVEANYDATSRTLAIKSGQIVARTAENDEPRYAIFAVMNATGDGWLDALEMQMTGDGDFVANDCFIGLAMCSDETLDAFLGRFWEIYQPGTAWTEWYVPHAPLASIGTSNLILNHSLNSDFKLHTTRHGLMAADAYLYFQNYTAPETYRSIQWSIPSLTKAGEAVDTLFSANETMQLRTSAPDWFGYPALEAVNEMGTSADTLNHTEGVTNGMIFAGGSSDFFADGVNVPFLMRAAVGTDFVEASSVAPGGAWAKQFNITHAYFYQGIPGNPLYFEGVDIPGCKFVSTGEGDSLVCRIRTCKRRYDGTSATTEISTSMTTLYTAQVAASEAFVETSADGYGYLHFGNFTCKGVDGDSAVSFMQVDEEFLIELIWPSNETLAFTPLMEPSRALAAPCNTFYSSESSGLMYNKLNARSNVWVSLANATYGYLHVEGEHTFSIPAEGGSVDVTVYPFDSEVVDGQRTTSLWLADGSSSVTLLWLDEAERDSSWVSAEIVSEDYTAELPNFTLRLTAAPMPEGVTSRQLAFTFAQRAARLELEILQGEGAVSAIEEIPLANTTEPLYNLYGQPVKGVANGIVVGRRTKALVR